MIDPSQLLSRRSFLGWVIAAVPLADGVRINLLAPAQRETLDDALLLALAGAVLPSEIGAAGARRAATGLQTWVRGYLPGAERNHAYGSARIQTTAADPAPRWALQLRSLDSAARSAHGQPFTSIGVEQRRALVTTQLNADRANSIPGDIASAQHVALAVLASYYGSPEATDLCYQAQIGRTNCRSLSTSSRLPLPLSPGGGA